MVTELARYWWAIALRGVVAILFGILAFVWPGLTLEVLAILFGAFVFVDGVFAIIAAVRARGEQARWWALLLEGITSVVLGFLVWLWPLGAVIVFIYFVAGWALITGLLAILAAIRLREHIEGEWRLVLSGVLSIVFALLIAFWPLAGVLAAAWMIGGYAILFGILLLALGWRLRGHAARAEGPAPA
jgi:uncharacterized membrane protein HdeD (DUF308 family)